MFDDNYTEAYLVVLSLIASQFRGLDAILASGKGTLCLF